MNQDEVTKDAFDTQLTRLFAEKNDALPDHEFMQTVLTRLQREHRMQWIRRGLIILVIMLLAAVVAPWVVQGTMGVFLLAGQAKQLPGIDAVITVGMVLIAGGVFLRARHRV